MDEKKRTKEIVDAILDSIGGDWDNLKRLESVDNLWDLVGKIVRTLSKANKEKDRG